MKKWFIVLAFLFLPFALCAQWSDDPFDNLQLSLEADTALASAIAPDNMGNYYVFYFVMKPEPQGFVCYLHKLDKDGNKLWGEAGILISDNPFGSWISDYSLIVDNDNNAIVAFEDARDEDVIRIVNLYKISPTGEFLWGSDGIQLPAEDGSMNLSPKVILANDNSFVVQFNQIGADENSQAVFYRLNENGEIIGNKIIKHTYSNPLIIEIWFNILPADNGNIYFFWNAIDKADNDTLIGGWGSRALYAQKLDADFNPVWANDVTVINPPVYSSFRLDHSVNYAQDDKLGVFISWFDNREWQANSRLNYLDLNGNLRFDEEGLFIERDAQRDISNLSPIAYYDKNEGAVFFYWIQEEIKKSFRGFKYPEYSVFANKLLDDKSDWEWGSKGKELVPFECGFSPFLIKAGSVEESAIQVIFFSDGNRSVETLWMNPDGLMVGTVPLSLSESVGRNSKIKSFQKNGITVTELLNDQWVAVWSDIFEVVNDYGTITFAELYAQNISVEGELGPVITGIIEEKELLDENSYLLYPNPANNNITIRYNKELSGTPTIAVYSAIGNSVKHINNIMFGSNTITFNVNGLPAGAYFVRLSNGNDTKVFKFVK